MFNLSKFLVQPPAKKQTKHISGLSAEKQLTDSRPSQQGMSSKAKSAL